MRLATLAALFSLAAAPAWAQPASVAVTEAWARATTGAGQTGAIYVTVTASQPDRLTGASTPAADMAEIHLSKMEGGVMQMRPVAPLELIPGTPIHMVPGGYHIMLMGLKQPLKQGDHVPVTLTFAHSAPITAQALVAGPGASQPPPMAH